MIAPKEKWGRPRTRVQRDRCNGCQKTCSGRTGSVIGRIHRPDLFMAVLQDMLESAQPQSVRTFAGRLGLDKGTIWRWRMLVFSIIDTNIGASFSGIVEADETYQRESRKGSREWIRRFAAAQNVAPSPRPRWAGFTTYGLKNDAGALEMAASHSDRC